MCFLGGIKRNTLGADGQWSRNGRGSSMGWAYVNGGISEEDEDNDNDNDCYAHVEVAILH